MPRKKPQVVQLEQTVKSFAGLRSSLFDEFDRLRNGVTDPTTANAVARLASEITKSAIAEINALRLQVRLATEDEKNRVRSITDGQAK